MEEESEGSSYITTSSLIDAQFHDLIHSDYESEDSSSDLMPKKSKKKSPKNQKDAELPLDDENQDWEWVEETEYVILDFGGVNLDARDMERLTENGYNLVGLDTPTPYFKAGIMTFKGFYDENAITEDLLFDMKAREAREEQEEGIEEDEDEDADALDLHGTVTKRIMFEVVDLIPNAEAEELRRAAAASSTLVAEKAPVKASSTQQGKPETKMSIWKAAYDAVGLERIRRNQTRPPAATTKRRGRKPKAAGNSSTAVAGPSSAPNMDPDNPSASANDDGDVEME
ncbi:MAG: hypothetical protein J3Q66DRAFT_394090 [Benniella sp.]|nr:MAG: hypothetical protein J3Q66DRAFT_394090 [Benniella sp.]